MLPMKAIFFFNNVAVVICIMKFKKQKTVFFIIVIKWMESQVYVPINGEAISLFLLRNLGKNEITLSDFNAIEFSDKNIGIYNSFL